MSRPRAIFTDPRTKIEIPISEEIICDGKKLEFIDQKTAGCNPGGWYADESGNKFMVKFPHPSNPAFPYFEQLLNDLAKVCVGKDFVAGDIKVSRATLDGQEMPCLVTTKVENYQDLINIEAASKVEADSVALRKPLAPQFHIFYAFCALIGNDDLNEENLGVITDPATEEKTPLIIDYGIQPPFLNQEQIASASVPFQLASFIGHRNLNGMQFVRRRYFGHDGFMNPDDRLKPQKENLKPEDISYLAVLTGVKDIVESESLIIRLAHENFAAAMGDYSLDDDQRRSYAEKFAPFAEILSRRITWMKENFAEDLAKLGDTEECRRLEAIKWRLHPKFAELMEIENSVFKQCALVDLEKNLKQLSNLLDGRDYEEILSLDLRDVEKSDIQDYANKNFILHNAILPEILKW